MSVQKKISVLLEPDEYDRFEGFCRDRGYKKSTLISKLIRDLLESENYASQRPLFSDEQLREGQE